MNSDRYTTPPVSPLAQQLPQPPEIPEGYQYVMLPTEGASRICVGEARKEMKKGDNVWIVARRKFWYIEEKHKEIESLDIDDKIKKINEYVPTLEKYNLKLEDVKWTIWRWNEETEAYPSVQYPSAQMVVDNLTKFNQDYETFIQKHNKFIEENNLKTEKEE